jgi:hypothetical protein
MIRLTERASEFERLFESVLVGLYRSVSKEVEQIRMKHRSLPIEDKPHP